VTEQEQAAIKAALKDGMTETARSLRLLAVINDARRERGDKPLEVRYP
jgi:hypothetical protein